MRSTSSRRDGAASSVCTAKRVSTVRPQGVLNATPAAARPRAIAMRPRRGTLWRGGGARIPATAEIDLDPGTEIHRLGLGRNADVAEMAGAIARRDVHAAAQRDRQVGKVAAHPAALDHDVGGGPGGAGVLVAETDVR